MGFGEAIQSGFKNYANFSGRAPRSAVAYWLLFTVLVNIVATLSEGLLLDGVPVFSGILGLVLFLPGLAVNIRRLHDIGKSGWNWLWFLTIIGLIPLTYWTYFKPGDEGENEYGANPLLEVPGVAEESAQSGEVLSPIQQSANVEEELNKLKKMLDDGLIEQSDYDAKKKELLGL